MGACLLSNAILVSFAGSVFSVTVSEGIDCFSGRFFKVALAAPLLSGSKRSANFDLSLSKSFR